MAYIQNNFTGGVISKSLFGRTDLAKWYNAAETLKNFIVHPHGGASNRPGTRYIDDALGEGRLIPFEFNAEQTYVLEFTELKMRVITDGGLVLDGASILEVVSPFAQADLELLNYVQSADVVFFAHPDYPPYELSRTSDTDWTFSTVSFVPTIDPPLAIAADWDSGATPTAARAMEYRATAITTEGEESLPTDAVSEDVEAVWAAGKLVDIRWNCIRYGASYKWVASGSGTDEYYMDLLAGGDPGVSEPSAVYDDKTEMTKGTPGSLAAGEWGFGDNDTIGNDRIYVRLSSGAADPDDATYSDGKLQIQRAEDNEYNVYKNPRGQFGWIGTTETPWFTDDNVEPDISFGYPINEAIFDGAGDYPGSVSFFKQRLVYARTDNAPQTIWASRIGQFNNFGKRSPAASDDSISATINSLKVNEVRHLLPLESLVIITSGSEWIMAETDPGSAIPFSFQTQGYRGGQTGTPLIAIGNTVLFIGRDGKHIRDLAYSFQDDKYVGDDVTIYSPDLFKNRTIKEWAWQENPDSILWMVMDDGTLISLTYVKEQLVFAFTEHETDGEYESIASIPTVGNDEVYFIVKRTINGSDVRFLEQLESRDFDTVRECKFADAALSWDDPKTITGITNANPGVITTSSAHGMIDGDKVYISDVVGMTTLNGNWYTVANATSTTYTLQDIDDGTDIDTTDYSAYVSGGFSREGVTTLSGFDHLEGETLSVLADGNVLTDGVDDVDITVTSGAIDLGTYYATINGGLGYESIMQTLDIEFDPSNSIQGKRKSKPEVTLILDDSRAAFVGPNADRLTEVKFLGQENYREEIPLFSGKKRVRVRPDYSDDLGGSTYIKITDPLPLTVLAIVSEVEVER